MSDQMSSSKPLFVTLAIAVLGVFWVISFLKPPISRWGQSTAAPGKMQLATLDSTQSGAVDQSNASAQFFDDTTPHEGSITAPLVGSWVLYRIGSNGFDPFVLPTVMTFTGTESSGTFVTKRKSAAGGWNVIRSGVYAVEGRRLRTGKDAAALAAASGFQILQCTANALDLNDNGTVSRLNRADYTP